MEQKIEAILKLFDGVALNDAVLATVAVLLVLYENLGPQAKMATLSFVVNEMCEVAARERTH